MPFPTAVQPASNDLDLPALSVDKEAALEAKMHVVAVRPVGLHDTDFNLPRTTDVARERTVEGGVEFEGCCLEHPCHLDGAVNTHGGSAANVAAPEEGVKVRRHEVGQSSSIPDFSDGNDRSHTPSQPSIRFIK